MELLQYLVSKMKIGIFYYSATGNTRLACQYVAGKLRNVDVQLVDITEGADSSLDSFDLVGFATFTDFWGPPYLMKEFVEKLPNQKDKPAFLFATHGGNMANLLKVFARWLSDKGFMIVGSHGLRVPESFPPAIVRGDTVEDAPNEREMRDFDDFIRELDRMIVGRRFQRSKVKVSLLARFAPAINRMSAKENMGEKYVDEARCDECGICQKACPYKAITIDSTPIFDEDKCYGCWACFNRCPTKAIYTSKLRGVGHYRGPTAELKRKLAVR